MKKQFFTATACLLALSALLAACNKSEAKYENLKTGEKVFIIQDANGEAIDSLTNEPVELYVNLETKDTIYGKTGAIVNNSLTKTENGEYKLNESALASDKETIDLGSGDIKVKIDGDEMKIKTDDKKIKVDGDESKVKYD